MIDPVHSLAFLIKKSRPGVYAVLVGSGVSRAAGIPTGWEITLDLIRNLAKLHGEACDPDPERWYKKKFEKDADYADLLKELANTPAERQQLLRGYYEPNDREGEKKPTAAHRAIAALAAQKFIRIIITTNVDHLVETALRDEGIEPTVLSSPDQVQGALPLIHTPQCCVFKVHGDYLDTLIRNTPAELDQYPPGFNRLLDQIFDEFGLIVCGWSAEWDSALRKAISRVPSRRFTTYWAVLRGDEPGDEAKRLIDHRKAQVIPIKDADAFFQTIQEHVESIEESSRPHPLPTKAAVKDLKHYLSSPEEHKIRFADLIDTTVEQVLRATSGEAFKVEGAQHLTRELVTARLPAYESACSTLLAMASIGGFWAEDSHYYGGWKQAMERLSTSPSPVSTSSLVMKTYPGRLLLYALGLGAVKSDKSDKLQFLNHIFKTTAHYYHYGGIGKWQRKEDYVLTALFNAEIMTWLPGGRLLGGIKKWYEPSNWLHDALRQPLKQLIPDDENYSFIFDKLEILIALGFGYRNKHQEYWVPLGAFYHREENEECILAEITESISQTHDRSPFVQCGIFGETSEECLQSLQHFKSFVLRCIKDPLRRTP